MDPIKEAFVKVKQDIATLQHEVQQTNQQIRAVHETLTTLSQHITLLQQTKAEQSPTDQQKKDILNEPYLQSSTGNEGGSNKPTNQPTNQPIHWK